eukprot:m.42799 g.42799  ORF g.42799 m.42799 type:complete len:154 (-) comp19214_c0_seq2:22-483(-)
MFGTIVFGFKTLRCWNLELERRFQVLKNCQRAVELNNLNANVKVQGLSWGQFTPELFSLPTIDWILGADVFYEPAEFEDAIATVAFLLRKAKHSVFVTAYQNRSPERSLELLLMKWKLTSIEIPLRDFYPAHLQDVCEFDNDRIHVLELRCST